MNYLLKIYKLYAYQNRTATDGTKALIMPNGTGTISLKLRGR